MKLCLYCKTSTSNPKFCSHSCSASFNNRRRRITYEQKVKTSETLRQGFMFETKEQKDARIQKTKKTWENNTERRKNQSYRQQEIWEKRREILIKTTLFEHLPHKLIKRMIYEENENICFKCGFKYTDAKTGKGPFEIHHVDGNKHNWKKENLEILCLNCHWTTENWRFRGKTHSEHTKKLLRSKKLKKTGVV